MHGFCIIQGMDRFEARNRMHSIWMDAAIFGTLILVWFLVTLWFLGLRLFGEKRMKAVFGLPKSARITREKSGAV